MSHVHEWVAHYDQVVYGESFQCECGDLMATDEIARRLNATERLSAEDAEKIAINQTRQIDAKNLHAYAAALEGDA